MRFARWRGESKWGGVGYTGGDAWEAGLILLVAATIAAATTTHSGIRVDQVSLLGNPVYLDEPSGWIADVLDQDGGTVRVSVSQDVDAAQRVFDDLVQATGRDLPDLPMGAEQSMGDGYRTALWRDANVVVSVQRPNAGALELSTMLFEALEATGPWPGAPSVTLSDGEVRVDGTWTYVTFRHPLVLDPFTLKTRPVRLIPTSRQSIAHDDAVRKVDVTAWDAYGRSVHATWHAPVPADAGAP